MKRRGQGQWGGLRRGRLPNQGSGQCTREAKPGPEEETQPLPPSLQPGGPSVNAGYCRRTMLTAEFSLRGLTNTDGLNEPRPHPRGCKGRFHLYLTLCLGTSGYFNRSRPVS